jgi:hypothetical protein
VSASPVESFDHQPYWCEENIWRLCRHPRLAAAEVLVAVIASDSGAVRVRHQRAADGDAVDWDYHVIAFARETGTAWQAWDLDSTLGCPMPAREYLDAAFAPPIPDGLAPRFRLIEAKDYLARFSSDRSHMRARDGSWLQPPPPWPAIVNGPSILKQLIDPRWRGIGEVVDLDELRTRLA